VSGRGDRGGEIFKFTWDARESIFASGLYKPWDLAFDSAGNLFFVDYVILPEGGGEVGSNAAVYKITPNGMVTIFASRLGYPSYLATDRTGNVFVADHENGVIYKYKPTGSRTTFASGLHHPVGMAFNRAGDLFVINNSIGNIGLGSIYVYKPNGSRTAFAVLQPSDRPADLAFDRMGNLLMADLGGNIYKYDVITLRPNVRTIFGSVPGSAQSLACDSAGNLLVVDAGEVNGSAAYPNAIYKFTQRGLRSGFALGSTQGEIFACLAFEPMPPAGSQ